MVVKGCLWKDMSELMGTKTGVFVIILFVNMAMRPFSVPCIINYIKTVELIVATKRLYNDLGRILLRHNDLIKGPMAHFIVSPPAFMSTLSKCAFHRTKSSCIMSPLGSLYLWVIWSTHFAIMSTQIKQKCIL